jgi:hypothetical protein
MTATCLGHECSEREYRANNKSSKVTGRKGTKCPDTTKPADVKKFDDDVIKRMEAQLDQQATDAAESDDCPDGCNCKKDGWPVNWTVLETGVKYVVTDANLDCSASVEITYDWECRERSGKCYKPAPKGTGRH